VEAADVAPTAFTQAPRLSRVSGARRTALLPASAVTSPPSQLAALLFLPLLRRRQTRAHRAARIFSLTESYEAAATSPEALHRAWAELPNDPDLPTWDDILLVVATNHGREVYDGFPLLLDIYSPLFPHVRRSFAPRACSA
jgi:hypothetical protein